MRSTPAGPWRGVLLVWLATATASAAADVRCEIWPAAPDGNVTDTLSDDALLARAAPTARRLPAFELDPAPAVPDVCALRALIAPPTTGDYTFAVAGDDTALLYLSTDDRPAGRRIIASVPAYTGRRDFGRYAAQTSPPVHLLAGHRYYAEAWLQNAEGDSHVCVGWTLPDGTPQAPIPADRLTAPADRVDPPSFSVGPVTASLDPDPHPADVGFHRLVNGVHLRVGPDPVDWSYLLYAPAAPPAGRYPLFVFLHGNGHQGNDLDGVLNEGPANYLDQDPDVRAAFPMLGLFPQLPDGWRWDTPGAAAGVNAVVRQVLRRYPRVDPARVYLTGLSMGGKGAWLTALDDPSLYADVTTFSAVAVRPGTAPKRLAGVPHVHIVCGADDGGFAPGSKAMFVALQPALGRRVEFTSVPHEGHGVWSGFYPDPAFYRELMTHHR